MKENESTELQENKPKSLFDQSFRSLPFTEGEISDFWNNVLCSLEAPPISPDPIKGYSGILHHPIALGRDDIRRRLILVVEASSPKVCALIQSDIEIALKTYSVQVIRPITFDTPRFLRELIKPQLYEGEKGRNIEGLFKILGMVYKGSKTLKLRVIPQIVDSIDQFSRDWAGLEEFEKNIGKSGKNKDGSDIDWSQLYNVLCSLSNVQHDREEGICAFPIGGFTDEELVSLKEKSPNEEKAALLKNRGIYQFFFPPRDTLLLNLMGNDIVNVNDLESDLKAAPTIGHPFSSNEILESDDSEMPYPDLINALEEKGMICSKSKLTIELTPEGKKLSADIELLPRAGIITRILRSLPTINIGINLGEGK